MLKDVLPPLIEMHEDNYVHRDFKIDNIVVHQDPVTGQTHFKIVDFNNFKYVCEYS